MANREQTTGSKPADNGDDIQANPPESARRGNAAARDLKIP
jgi:hypothetical protein